MWTLKFEFQKMFTCHETLFFKKFFQSLKNITILCPWTVQKQTVGHIWPAGHSGQPLAYMKEHRLWNLCDLG